MSVQHERLIELCNELRLGGIATQYPALAQTAAEKRTSFTDFLEELLVAERDREMSLAHARRSEENHVLGALDEGKAGQFHDLLARRAGGEAEVILVKRLDRREAGYPREHFACPRPTRFALGDQ